MINVCISSCCPNFSIFMALGLLLMMITDFSPILIASMSVKEVLQSLVDDNLVDTDKIGTSIYFWAYPSKALHTVSKLLGKTTQKIISGLLSISRVLCKASESKKCKMGKALSVHTVMNSVVPYWFSSQRQQKLQQLTEQIHDCEKRIASTTKLLKQANSGREQSVSIGKIYYVFPGIRKRKNTNMASVILDTWAMIGTSMTNSLHPVEYTQFPQSFIANIVSFI